VGRERGLRITPVLFILVLLVGWITYGCLLGQDPFTPEQKEKGSPPANTKEGEQQGESPLDTFLFSVAKRMQDTENNGIQGAGYFLEGLVYLELALDAFFRNVPKVLGNRLGVCW
jgi:hypothetical protein